MPIPPQIHFTQLFNSFFRLWIWIISPKTNQGMFVNKANKDLNWFPYSQRILCFRLCFHSNVLFSLILGHGSFVLYMENVFVYVSGAPRRMLNEVNRNIFCMGFFLQKRSVCPLALSEKAWNSFCKRREKEDSTTNAAVELPFLSESCVNVRESEKISAFSFLVKNHLQFSTRQKTVKWYIDDVVTHLFVVGNGRERMRKRIFVEEKVKSDC